MTYPSPPRRAVGPEYVVRTDAPQQCTRCGRSRVGAIVLIVTAVTLFILAVFACPQARPRVRTRRSASMLSQNRMQSHPISPDLAPPDAYVNLRRPELVTQGVGTVSIILTHLQTLRIVGHLRLHWPPSAEAFFDVLLEGLEPWTSHATPG